MLLSSKFVLLEHIIGNVGGAFDKSRSIVLKGMTTTCLLGNVVGRFPDTTFVKHVVGQGYERQQKDVPQMLGTRMENLRPATVTKKCRKSWKPFF